MSWADDIIDSLASLPGFPPAREHIARSMLARRLEAVMGWRAGQPMPAEPVSELLAAMLELDKWPGPATFFQLARRLARPVEEKSSAEIPHLRDYLPQPEETPDCPRCNGMGYVFAGGSYRRCFGTMSAMCPAGKNLGEVFFDLLNARTDARRGPVELKRAGVGDPAPSSALTVPRITGADIEDAVHLNRMQRALNDPDFSTGGK